jgi:hypothetical protein
LKLATWIEPLGAIVRPMEARGGACAARSRDDRIVLGECVKYFLTSFTKKPLALDRRRERRTPREGGEVNSVLDRVDCQ